jgi:hypothetical protein
MSTLIWAVLSPIRHCVSSSEIFLGDNASLDLSSFCVTCHCVTINILLFLKGKKERNKKKGKGVNEDMKK